MTLTAPCSTPGSTGPLPTAPLPLTAAQQGVWFSAEQLGHRAYVVTEQTEVTGELDTATWVAAMTRVLTEIPALRLRLIPGDGIPRRAHDAPVVTPEIIDLRGVHDGDALAEARVSELRSQSIDLTHSAVGAVALILTDASTRWLLQVHHLALDGYGFDLVTRRFVTVYEAMLVGDTPPPAAVDQGRLDAELSSYDSASARDDDRAAWADLAPEEPPTGLAHRAPSSLPEPQSAVETRLDSVPVNASVDRAPGIEDLLTAAALTASVHTGRREVVIGVHVLARTTPAALRTPAGLQNILPVPVLLDPWESVCDLRTRVAATWRRVRRLQRYRHEELRRDRGLISGETPFADAFVNLTPFGGEHRCATATLRPRALWSGPVEGLTFTVDPDGMYLESPADVLSARRLDEIAHTFSAALVAPRQSCVGALRIAPPGPGTTSLPRDATPLATASTSTQTSFCAGLRRLADTRPDEMVLADDHHTLTAAQTLALIDTIAAHLVATDAGPEQPVALECERGVIAALAPLAALEAATPFVPLDPEWPAARRDAVMSAAGIRHVLRCHGGRVTIQHDDLEPLDLPGAEAPPETSANAVTPQIARPQDAAYVLFTSGSTGTPKGVVVERRHLAAYADHLRATVLAPALAGAREHAAETSHGRTTEQVVSVHDYPATFDSSMSHLVMLADGHRIHVADSDTLRTPTRLAALVERVGAHVTDCSPAVLAEMIDAGLPIGAGTPLRTVSVGGDACSATLWSRLRATPGLVALNAYGPTECTVDALVADLADHPHPVIGHPVPGADAVVLDELLRPCPTGVPGELYLLGAGVARGYLDDAAGTATRFVAAPDGGRMYRTGDAARREESGSIAFLGRVDDQVSLRGQRIEPAEVERALMTLPEARGAVAVVRNGRAGDRLVGYVVTPALLDPASTTAALQDLLPAAWVPSAVVRLDALPLTARGKVDRTRLPEPPESLAAGRAYTELTDSERLVADTFAEVLDLDPTDLTAEADLFDLGGHSLTAARIVGRLSSLAGVDVPLRDVFARATPAALAELVDAARSGSAATGDGGEAGTAASSAAAVDPERSAPSGELTAAQRRLWFIEATSGTSPLYTIPLVITFTGELHVNALKDALADVIARHPSLRTLVPAGADGSPMPCVLTPEDPRARADLRPLNIDEGEDVMSAVRRAAADPRDAIDIGSHIPIRARLHRGEDAHVLLLTVHHIAADGWSVTPLLADLASAYRDRVTGATPTTGIEGETDTVSALPLPSSSQSDIDWWRDHLHGAPPEIDLPADRLRPARRSIDGGEHVRLLDPALIDRIHQVARDHDATPFMVFGAALSGLLTRCGGGEDIVLGTISSNRSTRAQERLITFCANTLAMRLDTSANPDFAELLARTREECLDVLSRAEVPFDAVVDAVNPPRAAHRHPLFQVLLVLQNTGSATWRDVAGVDARVEVVGTGTAKFDLTCEIDLDSELPRLRWEYARDMFDAATIERLDGWFARMLEVFLTEPGTRLWQHPLDPEVVTPPARRVLAPERTLTDWLEEVLTTRPDAVAVTDDDRHVTYAELDRRSAALADHLIAAGAETGTLVALALGRRLAQVVAILGVLRSGAAYLPLDPAYPVERLAGTVADAEPILLVHDEPTTALARSIAPEVPTVRLDTRADVTPLPGARPRPGRHVTPADPAYVIFTSGSTGRPKGVRVTHANVVRLLTATQDLAFDEHDTWTLFHSYAFDFSVWEIFGSLCHGGRLVIVDADTARSPEDFRRLLARERVTVLNQTPSAFAQLVAADTRLHDDSPDHSSDTEPGLSLRLVIFGGEALDPAVLPPWFARHPAGSPRLVNMYGITETTVHVTAHTIDEQAVRGDDHSPVGTPLPDLRVHLLDAGLHPVPPGVVGEIYVSGPGLADGYLGRPDLTAARFVAAPARDAETDDDAPRMYRSGDLAVRRPDGSLDFRGRSDRQVQLRGFRIELGEVEAAALTLPDVDQAHARICRLGAGDERLVLDLVGPDVTLTDPVAVRASLRDLLPAQMVPSAVVVLDALPLTVNGKLDVAALPTPELRGRTTRPPADPREQMLTEVFAELLALPHVGVDDSFFDLGGHSLLAVRLLHRIGEVWGAHLGITDLFDHPTPALLSTLLDDDSDTGSPFDVLIPLRANRGLRRPGVFCVHPAGGLSWCYTGFGRHLDPQTPLWGLQARGVQSPEHQPTSLADMADDYIEQILAVQPTGPYHLLGWSLGGMVVHVMAARLRARGHEVGVVALLDAYPSQAETGIDEPPLEDALSALLAMGGLDDDVLGDRPVVLESVADAFAEAESALGGLDLDRLSALVTTYRNTARILREYAHEAYDGDVVFFHATRAGVGPEHDPHEWDRHLTGRLIVHDVDATHREMTQPGALAAIGTVIAGAIRDPDHTAR